MKFLMKNSLINPEIKAYIKCDPSNVINLSSSSEDNPCSSDIIVDPEILQKCDENGKIDHESILKNL